MIWKPDTCACVLEYNGANTPANFVRAISRCADHSTDATTLDDNQLKNRAAQAAAAWVAAQKDPSVVPEDITWRFDAARTCFVKAPARVSLTGQERAALRSAVRQIPRADLD